MTAFLQVMAAPFAACVLLVLIHAALGRHVLARGVIFVDLAMAQVAALGAAVGYLRGYEPHSVGSYLWSFGFTLLGAALFSFLWDRNRSVLQEAFIGITFAFGGALSLLLLSGAPHGGEEFQASLIGGGLLWLGWSDVGVMVIFYGAVGVFLWKFHPVLMRCSEQHESAQRSGIHVRWWDFLFYAAFGLVVTSSVKAAGILAVFTFLIVPTVCAVLLGKREAAQLWWAWGIGIVGSTIAVVLSYVRDWPTGASVVCVFGCGVVLVSIATHSYFKGWKNDRLER
jgi:zinc/manganese transport system permease protein